MMTRSHGPVVYHEPDGSFRASCRYCGFRSWSAHNGGQNICTFKYGEVRPIPDPKNTPEWCEMREGMLRDAVMMAAFAAEGLDASKKKDVLEVVRSMPKELQPKGARTLDIMQLHNAIRRAWDAGWRLSDARLRTEEAR